MLARIQQFITLSLMAIAIAWAAYFLREGQPWKAGLGIVMIIFGYAAVLGLEFIALAATRKGDRAPPASARQLLRAWWGEVLTAPIVFCWRQPFRSLAVPDHLPVPALAGVRGVVLVHGFVCNRGLWNPWMRQLEAKGIPFIAVNLEPVFGSIDAYVQTIERAVEQLAALTNAAPVLVAHSMGGLAARAWLAATDGDARVHRVITIGTPHRGTWLARFGHTLNGQQMRVKGLWLAQLEQREPPQRHATFTCFYSHCDNIVFPPSNATLPGADNRHVPGVAHVHLASQQVVFDEIVRSALEPPRAEANIQRDPLGQQGPPTLEPRSVQLR